MGVDISSSAKEVSAREDKGTWIEYRDEQDELYLQDDGQGGKKPVRGLVVGTYSARYRRAQEEMRRGMIKSGRGRPDEKIINTAQLKLEGSLVVEWEFVTNGAPSKPEVLFEEAPWIRKQTVDAGEDHARFFESAFKTL